MTMRTRHFLTKKIHPPETILFHLSLSPPPLPKGSNKVLPELLKLLRPQGHSCLLGTGRWAPGSGGFIFYFGGVPYGSRQSRAEGKGCLGGEALDDDGGAGSSQDLRMTPSADPEATVGSAQHRCGSIGFECQSTNSQFILCFRLIPLRAAHPFSARQYWWAFSTVAWARPPTPASGWRRGGPRPGVPTARPGGHLRRPRPLWEHVRRGE